MAKGNGLILISFLKQRNVKIISAVLAMKAVIAVYKGLLFASSAMWKEIWSGTKFWRRVLRGTKAKLRSHYIMRTRLLNLLYNVERFSWRGLRFSQISNRMSMTSSIEILIGGHDEKSIDLINERLIYLITPTWREMNIIFNIFLNVWGYLHTVLL